MATRRRLHAQHHARKDDDRQSLLEASIVQGSGAVAVGDTCWQRQAELRGVVDEVNERWRNFEERLYGLEHELLEVQITQHFGLQRCDIEDWTPGGPRQAWRERIHGRLLKEVDDAAAACIVCEEGGADTCAATSTSTLIMNLIAQSDGVHAAIEAASEANKKLDGKIRRTEREEKAKGIMSLGMQDTKQVAALKRDRPAIWEVPWCALDSLSRQVDVVNAFAQVELAPEKLARRLAAAPAIIARAVSDWLFEKCVAEAVQLEKWWNTTKSSLSKDVDLWAGLQESDGLFIRRIDRGLEEVNAKRSRYSAYATFGSANEHGGRYSGVDIRSVEHWPTKLDEDVVLVSKVLAEMRDGLLQVRNSAMWRVIESARQLQRQLKNDRQVAGASASWGAISVVEGARALRSRVDESAAYAGDRRSSKSSEESLCLSDSGNSLDWSSAMEGTLLVTLRRLDCLIAVAVEVRETFDTRCGSSELAPITEVLTNVSKILAGLQEELLAVLDEPSTGEMREWLALWRQWDACELARALEASVCCSQGALVRILPKDKLLLLRGIHALLDGKQGLRMQLVSAFEVQCSGSDSSASMEADDDIPCEGSLTVQDLDQLSVLEVLQSEPPTLTRNNNASPNHLTPTRPTLPTASTDSKTPASPGHARDTKRVAQRKTGEKNRLFGAVSDESAACFVGSPLSQPFSQGVSGGAAEISWGGFQPGVLQPWSQKGKGLSACSSQPTIGPASHDPAAARDPWNVRAPSVRLVDGQCIPLRPGSTLRRLEPLAGRPSSSSNQRAPPPIAWA
jgi:hypothetical protein